VKRNDAEFDAEPRSEDPTLRSLRDNRSCDCASAVCMRNEVSDPVASVDI